MKPPRVSVVMTAYNRERYVEEAIRSVLAQTFPDFELIVVDDGSTDATAAILARLAAEDPRIRIITQTNQGIVRAANAGCAAARGEYLARFDSDDVCLPERLARQVEFLDRHPGFAVVAGTARLVDEEGNANGAVLSYHADGSSLRARLEDGCWIIQPAVLMRRSAFEEAGPYRQGFAPAEDYDLWLRIADTHDLANLPDPPMILYRVHASQASERHKRHQAIGALVALTATRTRRATGTDPIARDEDLSPEVLGRIGLGEREVESAVAELDLLRMSLGIRTDSLADLDTKQALLARLARAHPWRWYGTKAVRLRRELEIESAIRRAKLLLRSGAPLRAAGALGMAVCRHPVIVRRLITALVRTMALAPAVLSH